MRITVVTARVGNLAHVHVGSEQQVAGVFYAQPAAKLPDGAAA